MKKKIRAYLQVNANESGSTCLAMIAGYYHKWLSLEQAAMLCDVSRDGCFMEDIRLAAEDLKMESRLSKIEARKLGACSMPAIIELSGRRFAVLKRVNGDSYELCNPACGLQKMTTESFEKEYQGQILELAPGADFKADGKPVHALQSALDIIRNSRDKLMPYGCIFIVLAMLFLLYPLLTKYFADEVLTSQNAEFQRGFLLFYGGICIVTILLQQINVYQYRNFSTDVSLKSNRFFSWKLWNLPYSFYKQRAISDLLTRKVDNRNISHLLTTQLCEIVARFIMIFVCFVMMAAVSVPVFLLLISMTALSYFFMSIQTKWKQEKLHHLIQLLNICNRSLYDGYFALDTIQNAGAEYTYFRRFLDAQADASYVDSEFMKLDYTIGMLPQLCSELTKIMIVACGVYGIFTGRMTYGSILAIQGIYAMIADPISYIAQVGPNLFSIKYKLERIEAVKRAELIHENAAVMQPEDYKLSGDIILRDVTFGYSRHREPLMRHLNLEIHAGEQVAIVGKTGCGKSTLKNLLIGQLEAWSGEICYSGKRKNEISPEIFSGSVASVDQSITLFPDTAMNNIKMWDASIEDFEAVLAAKDAQLYDMLIKRAKGFETRLALNGQNLSGGERQKLELARALALEPTILILDEATSALDAIAEQRVSEAIQRRGITTVRIAHRLSAIRSCDRIYVMEKGSITASGTHEELMKSCSLYMELITQE